MEILRFEEAVPTTPKRKKSSKGYLTAGFVAALFSVGSAFATTTTSIAINENKGISLGQGVTLAAACDAAISVVPTTAMTVIDGAPVFNLTSLEINAVDAKAPGYNTEKKELGCGGKVFDVQIFNTSATPTPFSCIDLKLGTPPVVKRTGATTEDATLTCTDFNKLTLPVTTADGDVNYKIEFGADAPTDISYITLVTRQPSA
jgi:hypothetical protein